MRESKTTRQVLTATLLGISLYSLQVQGANNPFEVDVRNQLVSISANGASLLAVADRLSELVSIPINHTAGSDHPISVTIVDESLEKAISLLFGNNVIVRRMIDGEAVITEILLLLDVENDTNIDASLPTGEPVAGIVVEADQHMPQLKTKALIKSVGKPSKEGQLQSNSNAAVSSDN